MPKRHHSSETTPCSNSCRSVSCTSLAQESRTTSPTRPGGSASPFGSSAARERRSLPLPDAARRSCVAATLLVSILCPTLRRGGERRDHYIYAHGATTMLALGLVLNTLGIGLF